MSNSSPPERPAMAGGPPPQRGQSKSPQYFLGLGLGLIPLILAFVGLGINVSTGAPPLNTTILLIVALILYIAEFIATIVCLVIDRIRFIGYGLLTMVLASPVVFFIGCIVILTRRPA